MFSRNAGALPWSRQESRENVDTGDASSSSVHGNQPLQNALRLAKTHLENARRTNDPELARSYHNESIATLSRMEDPTLETLLSSDFSQDSSLREEVIFVLSELDTMRASFRQSDTTEEGCAKVGYLSVTLNSSRTPLQNSATSGTRITAIPRRIFAENKRPPAIEFKLPECGEPITDTPQLACCLGLLQTWCSSPDTILDPTARRWLSIIDKNADEIDRLMTLATDVITTFVCDGIKDVDSSAEALRLVPVLDKAVYRYMLEGLCNDIERSPQLDSHQLECLAQVIQGAPTGYLEATDLTRILELINSRQHYLHQQSKDRIYELSIAISSIVDAMADTTVNDLNREQIHRSMSNFVDGLKATSDPYFVYQAAYTYQALHHVMDNETIWDTASRRAQKLFMLVEHVNAIDVKHILKQLQTGYEHPDGRSNVGSQDENRKALLDYLKEGGSFNRKESWYPTLRTVDALLRGGQFTEFKKLVLETPCRRHPAFQWGLCRLLGTLAANAEWDTKTRLNAIAFLEDMHKNDTVWRQSTDIKELIVTILTQLVSLPESIKQAAQKSLQQLGVRDSSTDEFVGQVVDRIWHRDFRLDAAFPSHSTPSLLDRVQDTPGIESKLRQLRNTRLTEQQNAVYVEHHAKVPSPSYDTFRLSLMEYVKEFLRHHRKVLLLLGASGSGKSTFNRVLERELWRSYRIMEGHIPLYIDLSAIDEPTVDPISKCLRTLGFTEGQIKELKTYRKFIVICDEYDQIRQPKNLYTINNMNQPEGWNGKLMISCRSEYLGSCSLNRFQPTDQNSQVQPELFQQVSIEPFYMDQVQDYIKQYVFLHKPLWKTDDYMGAFKQDRCLQELSTNPLLLSLTLKVLPRLVESQQELSVKRFNKATIYDQIVNHWFERGKAGSKEGTIADDDSERVTYGNLVQNGIDFLKRLSAAIYKNQGGAPVVEYSHLYSGLKQDSPWKDDFFSQDGHFKILREASPLKCSGTKLQFIHQSILEYGLTLSVYDPQEFRGATESRPGLTRRRSTDSVMSFESNGSDDENATTVDQGPDHGSPLNWRSFVNDHSILAFLEDRVHQEPLFKQKLMAIIEFSKTDKKSRIAAANAITILVGAGIPFNGADLRRIKVPGANLSHGMFESAQLQETDLRKTTLCGAWLYKADLSEADMKGARFGELPYFSENRNLLCCAYSPDGRYFAVGLENGDISLYTTTNWKRIRTLSGHAGTVLSMEISTNDLMVSGSTDKTARLWDIETGKCVRTFIDTDIVYGVAFSPQSDQIATGVGGNDNTVRLWDVSSGECQQTLGGHSGSIFSVAYSPNGRQVASGSADKTLRLWGVETGILHYTLSGHEGTVFSVAFSPHGHLIASGSADNSVRLWDVKSGTCQSIIRGHSESIRCVAFSPQGNLIVSGSEDKSVRLWDVETGASQNVWSAHNSDVKCVVFSPDGNQIISGCFDGTVRLWTVGTGHSQHNGAYHIGSVSGVAASSARDLIATGGDDGILRLWDTKSGVCVQALNGHSDCIKCVAFSPAGDQVASGGLDRTVRIWDAETGASRHVMAGHVDYVRSVAFSPSGILVVSASDDKTIRLWDVQMGHCSRIISGHDHFVLSVEFSPTGDRIVSGSHDKTVRLWNAETGKCVRTLSGHNRSVIGVAFSPAGNMIASSSHDDTVRLWDASSGQCRHVLSGHNGSINGVVFSPNGDQVASSGNDKSVRVWSVASGQCLVVICRFQGPVNCLAWCTKSDRDCLATGEGNGAVQFFKVRKLTEGGGRYDVRQCWMSPRRLDATDAIVKDVHGLTDWDKRLLKQRGAVNIPDLDSAQE